MIAGAQGRARAQLGGIPGSGLPRYLAEFQWRFNRRFGLEDIQHRLLRAGALTPPMPQKLPAFAEVSR